MSHNLFENQGDDTECLPEMKIRPPTPEPVEEEESEEECFNQPPDMDIKEVDMFQKDKKLLDDVDAKDWRKANNKKAVGQRGPDKQKRKKAPLSEKKLKALAKARLASQAKAKARREALEEKEQPVKKQPEKVELKVEEIEEEKIPSKGRYVKIDEDTVKEEMEPPPLSPPKLRRQKAVVPPPTPPPSPQHRSSQRSYTMDELRDLAGFFGNAGHQAGALAPPPVAPPIEKQINKTQYAPRKSTPGIQRRAGQKKQPREKKVYEPNRWDDYFLKA